MLTVPLLELDELWQVEETAFVVEAGSLRVDEGEKYDVLNYKPLNVEQKRCE